MAKSGNRYQALIDDRRSRVNMTPTEIKALRRSLPSHSGRRLYPTQREFGLLLGLSGRDVGQTVRHWERGRRVPSGPVLRLMLRLREDPSFADWLSEQDVSEIAKSGGA